MCVSVAIAALSAVTSIAGGLSASGAASAQAKAAKADAARKTDILATQAQEQANLAEEERQKVLARNRAIAGGLANIGDSASFNRIQAGITENTMDDISATLFNSFQEEETIRLQTARRAANAKAQGRNAMITAGLGAAQAGLSGYSSFQKLKVPGGSGLTDAERYNKLDSGPRNRFYAT